MGVVVFVVALGVGYLMGEPDCEDGLCAEYVPFFVGLFLEIALGAIAVLAVAAVIVRVARAT
jgi:hypothetical protein